MFEFPLALGYLHDVPLCHSDSPEDPGGIEGELLTQSTGNTIPLCKGS